jgi:cell division protein FtsN
LTFYNTLPKGSRAVIGSGLNPPKAQEKHPPATAAPAASPTTTGAAVPEGKPVSQPPKAPEHPAAEKEKKPAEAVRYTVQLASYRERREAEAVRDKLVAKGVAAFLLESRLADKGVWYRLRVGKGLTQQQAGEVAAKLGREALVVPE